MKTLIATLLMTAAFLSAGAFAYDHGASQSPSGATNITVITKNQAWPIKSQMTIEPCRVNRCIDA